MDDLDLEFDADIIIGAIAEKLRHWRWYCKQAELTGNIDYSIIAGDIWKNHINGDMRVNYWLYFTDIHDSANEADREYSSMIDSMLETGLNKFNRSFFASWFK